VGASRNLGVRYGAGEYVAFLDHDDVWLPHKLERQVALMRAYPEAGMVYGRSLWWYGWTGRPEDLQRDAVYEPPSGLTMRPDTLIGPVEKVAAGLRGEGWIGSPSGILVTRKVFERVGGFEEGFVGRFQMYEDPAFYAKVGLAVPVFSSSECWIKYRQHPNSVATKTCRAGLEPAARLHYLNWLERYVSDQGITDRALWQALETALWPYRHPILYRLRTGWAGTVGGGLRARAFVVRGAVRALPGGVRHWLRIRWPDLGTIADHWVA
jgi:glycosyltransferase involved in cell wall biosynthesis